jgi:RNA dependent RNA polymerase
MTDGCGFMNLAALQAITRYMGYEYLPTAVQGRFDGAKGLWIRHPYDESDEPRIWIRASQNKIKNHSLDRAHLIFELLTPSKPSTGDALSQQSILNLWYNGVPAEDLIKLFEEGLREQVEPLLEWNNMILLYHAVNKAGGVAGSRMARLATTMSRAFGLERQQWGNDEVDATEEDNEGQATADLGPATYTGRNPYSGCGYHLAS